jgi:hypothetical protein
MASEVPDRMNGCFAAEATFCAALMHISIAVFATVHIGASPDN